MPTLRPRALTPEGLIGTQPAELLRLLGVEGE